MNTKWGQKGKRACETSLKGSVTGKTYEAAFYPASQSSIKNAVDLFDVKKKKNPTEQTSKRFQMPKETLIRNHYSFNQTHIPGIQSYPISKEKILVQC